MNDSNVVGGVKVDNETIRRARESLRRRRCELSEQKGKLIASYHQRVDSSSPSGSVIPTTEDDDAANLRRRRDDHPMIERGRTLLAEAEASSEILMRYASFRNSIGIVKSSSSSSSPRESREVDESPMMTVRGGTGTNSTLSFDPHHDRPSYECEDDFPSAARHVLPRQGSCHVDGRPSVSHDDSESTPKKSRTIIVSDNLPVESPYWECEYDDYQNDRRKSNDDDDEGMEEPLIEGDVARARLDELIAAVHRRGDDAREHSMLEDTITPTKKSIANFDPSSMNAARRAVLRKVKLDDEVAAAEEESRLLTTFKALPLPGGTEVKNNIFASTRAFQGKQILCPVEKLIRRGDANCDRNDDASSSSLSGTFCGASCDGYSMATSRTGREDSFGVVLALGNETDRDRERQLIAEKRTKKRQLLDAIDQIVADEMRPEPKEEDDSALYGEGFDIVEDPSKLLQDIAQLKAKLKQKRNQRLAIMNDIIDIDLNAPFERLLSENAGVEMRSIIDRLKKRVCGVNANDFQIVHATGNRIGESQLSVPPQRGSVFIRQQEWAKRREQKLFNARLQQEADAMDGITGMPQMSHATQSWQRARDSHDEALRRVAEEESTKQQQKEAKEKALNDLKNKEMEELQKQANAKAKSMKNEVDKEEQIKRIESLSRPRQTREVLASFEPCAGMVGEQQPDPTFKSKVYLSPKPPKKLNASKDERFEAAETKYSCDKKPDEFCGKSSFSEMSDKEFAKLVKTIGKNASSMAKE